MRYIGTQKEGRYPERNIRQPGLAWFGALMKPDSSTWRPLPKKKRRANYTTIHVGVHGSANSE